MNPAALLIGIALVASPSARPQMLVVDGSDDSVCRPAVGAWDPAAVSDRATAVAVSEDIRRYFAGLSAQFTSVLDAAWNGTVRFCTDADEAEVLETLAVLVVKPPPASLSESGVPDGAGQLLTAFAGRALVRQLDAVRSANPAEAVRKVGALRIVRKAMDR